MLWLMGPLLVLLLLDTAVSYFTSVRLSNLAHDRSLHEIARELALQVKPGREGPELALPDAVQQVLLADQDDTLYFALSAADGRLVAGDGQLAQAGTRPQRQGAALTENILLRGQPVRLLSAWMPFGESGLVLVQVAETLNKRQRLARDILVSVVVPQLLLIVLAAAVVRFGVARGLRPLQRLQAAVSDRSHLDLSPVDSRGVPGELRPLLDEVNALLLRLQSTLEVQGRFIADASHQLKTPVSGLKAQIELALRETDPAQVKHCLAQLYVSADRLSRLVQQLLLLARNEPGAANAIALQRLDLRALAMDVAMQWVPEALKRHIDLGFEALQVPVLIEGDPDRLRELLNNLIDNAVRYSQQQGRVTVELAWVADGRARLAVSDDSMRIPADERERIFERFHRLLGSHADGSGLGLAIVSEIAALHQASITLEDDCDGIGNTFSVFFPPARSARA